MDVAEYFKKKPEAEFFKEKEYNFFLCGKFLNTNILLTKREGRTREYWPEDVAIQKRPTFS